MMTNENDRYPWRNMGMTHEARLLALSKVLPLTFPRPDEDVMEMFVEAIEAACKQALADAAPPAHDEGG